MKQEKMRLGTALLLAVSALAAMALPVYALPKAADASSAGEAAVRPIAENMDCATYRDVRMQNNLRASDPDGGALTYRLEQLPKKGTVTLSGEDGAVFVYTPDAGKTGKDTFTFCAEDEDGNVSAPATVSVEILKGKTGVRYADMKDNAAHAASIRLAEAGVFTGRQVGKEYFFDPEAQVTRGEFLAMTMAAAGMDDMDPVGVTGFSDDESIPTWAKAYASEALNQGVISGKLENDRVVFSAQEPITYSEAAAILNRTMAVTDVNTETFAGEHVPAWAVQSVANLTSVRVMDGKSDAGAPLDRAAAAQLLCSAMDLMEDRSEGPLGWLR